ncbi:hypothetical protein AUEXF2481DRAFT_30745 [Aureobasidium subglaciale EXF-2481]|uniref:Uncharacterized protein n=1 Tax=Aureobasidium subglaciale (strain EXF-2481) TaxID=1043005 RepID=A0A074Y8W6_AURSE|nr:uncharacterized protein AUEXF2481DRAFT_30745 [Aureobasidium subglaciale EXF-2481]KEQ94208.1 hypothetical protein AUEXF2481DRAFT_30745 [Aureobasidium subglaciale EXF-2481]
MAGCYIAGRSSGAHLNPATAIILDVFRGFPKNEILVCIVGQLIGAYVNSIVAYRDYLKGMLGLLNDDSDRMSEVWTLPSNPLINIDTERFFASTGLALENLGLDGYDIIGDKWYCCAPTTGVIVGGTRDDFSILL